MGGRENRGREDRGKQMWKEGTPNLRERISVEGMEEPKNKGMGSLKLN